MKWFGPTWHAAICTPEDESATPIGASCAWCEEAIGTTDAGLLVPHTALHESGIPGVYAVSERAYHVECWMRMCLGSAEHIEHRCSRFGGTAREEGPRRKAAIRAVYAARDEQRRLRGVN